MIWLIITGFLSGIITGMGLGGVILIPALTMILKYSQKAAQGISLVYFIPTSLIALMVHIKNKNIDFKIAKPLALWGIAGAISGSLLVKIISATALKKIFACLLLIIGVYQIINPLQKKFRKGK